MNQFVKQTKAVFLKSTRLQLRKQKLLSSLSVPFLCGLLLLITLFKPLEALSFAQLFYMPSAICGIIRSYLMMIVNEKKDRQKENQLIMGLKLSSYYFGWILSCLFLTFICLSLYFFMLFIYLLNIEKAQWTFEVYSSFFALYLFYSFAMVGQMFFFSSFFVDGRKATDFYAVMFLISLFALTFVIAGDLQYYRNIISAIFPQIFMIQLVVNFIATSAAKIYQSMVIFTVQGLIGMILYIYFDQVIHNEYGTHKKPFFFLKFLRRQKQQIELIEDELEFSSQSIAIGTQLLNPLENIQDSKETSIIQINQLTKKYDGIAVVDHLNLNIQKNQIFCLLGHNGAGKSTTINMICGLIEKDSGNIVINNVDIDTNLDQMRQNLGFCTQKDVIYSELSVYDHLKYYGQIKLIPSFRLLEEIEQILTICQLSQDKHQLGMYLSGGGKRKLCLAIALIGKSQVLLLDEPTTGLDPINRQQVWSILREVKKDRCIILTTHYLDEAEELADKVGIIQLGKLSVYGTVEQIKRQFSVGYNISIECEDEKFSQQVLDQVQPQINTLCKIQLKHSIQNRLIRLNVPLESEKMIASVLEYLETIKEINLSLEMTTLEDAYIKIHTGSDQNLALLNVDLNCQDLFTGETPQYNLYKQTKGLILRRIYIAKSNKWQYILYIAVWIFLIFAFIGFEKINPASILGLYALIKMLFVSQQAYYPIYEKQHKIKQSLITHGTQTYNYWVSNFVFDFFVIGFEQTVFLIIIRISSFVADNHNGYGKEQFSFTAYLSFIVANILFSVNLNCQSYLASHFFQSTHTSNVQLPIIFIIYQWTVIGIYSSLIMVIDLKLIGQFFSPLLTLTFQYEYIFLKSSESLTDYAEEQISKIMESFIITILSSVSFFLLINILDYRKFLLSPSGLGENIEVTGLNQNYGDKVVLKDVSFQVKRKQIFGLLGPNGAGKTTTFDILTRIKKPKSGTVEIQDEKKNVGVVPSFSPLYEDLTFQEHLQVFGLIKGLDYEKIKKFTMVYCQIMDIQNVDEKKVKLLSGGQRRKVQLGISLIGGSSKLFMDEPTSGIDPVFRRQFQEMIIKHCDLNQSSTVITTHSMQEAQHICDILGIMINGQLKFNGTLNELRALYDNRIQVSFHLKQSSNLITLQEIIGSSGMKQAQQIQDLRANYLSYLISSEVARLSQLFRFCQSKQVDQLIQDFEISPASLDQIFKHYVQQQSIIEEPAIVEQQNNRLNCIGYICCQV